MKLYIKNIDGELSSRDVEYAKKKLTKLAKFFSATDHLEVHHKVTGLSHDLIATIRGKRFYFCTATHQPSVQAGVDDLYEILVIRLRKIKTKIVQRHHGRI